MNYQGGKGGVFQKLINLMPYLKSSFSRKIGDIRTLASWVDREEIWAFIESSKQYDVQDVEAWLSSETAYETASETCERITGVKLSENIICMTPRML